MTDSTTEEYVLDEEVVPPSDLQESKLSEILTRVETLALETLSQEEPTIPIKPPKKPVPNFKKPIEEIKEELPTIVGIPETPETPVEETSFDTEETQYLQGDLSELAKRQLILIVSAFLNLHTPPKKKRETNQWRIKAIEKAESVREVVRAYVDQYPPPPDFREAKALKILTLLKEITFGWHLPVEGAKGELPPHPIDQLKKVLDLTSSWRDLKKTHHEVRKDWTDYCLKLFMNCVTNLQGDGLSMEDRVIDFINAGSEALKTMSVPKPKAKGKGRGGKK